jgi:hypothetical protein
MKWLMDNVTKARRAAIDSVSQSPLNQLMIALLNYEDQYHTLPPAYIADANGKPMHSWRVLILPLVDHDQPTLYDEYDFNEPWDGPNNIKLLDRMPGIFHSPSEPASSRYTNIVIIAGSDTAFPYHRSVALRDISDGRQNTILATEIADSKIPWLEPRDLDARTMSFRINDDTKPSISAVKWRLPYVVFADQNHAYRVSPATPPESLRALTTIAGQEEVTRDQLEDAGFLD